jgi:malate dehydrogenase (oxaloacetate-decarboxylating)
LGRPRKIKVTAEAALAFNRDVYYGHGKLEVLPKVAVRKLKDIATVYTPGAGFAVREIVARPEALSEQTAKDNMIAVVTDGSAVLGLGNVGPRAAAPVMEGKAVMFKLLVGIDSIALNVEARDGAHLVDIMCALEPSFGGYNLEDVRAPVCFDVMNELKRRLPIPVLHDDQYGTATVVTAALMNAWKVTGRDPRQQRIVVNGAGASGTATVDLLLAYGVGDIVVHDKDGIVHAGRDYPEPHRRWLAGRTNRENRVGGLVEAMRGADIFVGLSVAGQVTSRMVASMAPAPIVLALANPIPEIMPEEARAGGAVIVGTGRYDYPNQCNNVLGFPALLRGALDTKAREINHAMCLAAAAAIASDVSDDKLSPECIVPTPLSTTLYPRAAEAAARAAVASGVARLDPGAGWVESNTRHLRELVSRRQRSLAGATRWVRSQTSRG